MQCASKKIIGLPVYTAVAGEKLGRVIEINLDSETHGVREYVVKSGWKDFLLVKPAQVRAITAVRMTVDDGLLPEATPLVGKKVAPRMLEGALSIKEN